MEMEWASSLTLTALVLIFASIFLKSQVISKSAQKYSHIPGPKKLPLIGNLHQMLHSSAPHHMFTDLAHKYGGLLHFQLGELHFVIMSSVDSVKQLLTTHDVVFASRPPGLTPEILGYNYSSLAFAPYGDYWRRVKKIFMLELLSATRVRSFRHIREEEISNLAKRIASLQGSPVNLSEMARMLSFDIIARASVGAKTRDRESVIFIMKQIINLVAGFSIADLYPSIKCLPFITGIRFKLDSMRRRLDKVVSAIIEQHRGGDKDGGDNVVEDLVDVLLKYQQDGIEHPLTDNNIKGLLQSIFAAGSDTSATVVVWAMSNMIKNPSVLKKAQDEVRKVFDGDNGGYVDEDKFEELEYLKLVIKETLRLYPPAPLVPRTNNQKCEINGCEIPANTRVLINVRALGRDTKHWGEDAEMFIPERFGENVMDYKGCNYEYLPFGSGRRACPGMSFALANVEFALASLLYHFDWQMPGGMSNEDLDMTEEFGATILRKHPLNLIPTLRRPFNINFV